MLFTFNAVVSLLDTFLPQAPWGGSWLLVAVVVDILYLVAYEPGSTAMTERVQKSRWAVYSRPCVSPSYGIMVEKGGAFYADCIYV